MGITIIIVAGIVIISVVAVVGDFITKSRTQGTSMDPGVVRELRDRIEALERQETERESRLERLEGDVAFTTRLLEDRHDTGK